MAGRAKRDARLLLSAERAAKALELRTKHLLTYAQIAQAMGLHDVSAARKLIQRAIERLPAKDAEKERKRATAKNAEQERRMLERIGKLDELSEKSRLSLDKRIALLRALNDAERTLVKVHERRARLLGTDKQRFEITGADGAPLDLVSPHDEVLGLLSKLAESRGEGADRPEPEPGPG